MKGIASNLSILIIVSFIFSSCASVKDKKLNNNKEQLIVELLEILDRDQENRLKIMNLKKDIDNNYLKTIDSLKAKQIEIDKENTYRLIRIIKKYGFPSTERIGKPIPIWLIFQHTPEEYKTKVHKLITKEHKYGRFPSSEYKMIQWHLNGRKELIGNTLD